MLLAEKGAVGAKAEERNPRLVEEISATRKQNHLSMRLEFYEAAADLPFALVGVSGSDRKLPNPFKFMVGEKTSLI